MHPILSPMWETRRAHAEEAHLISFECAYGGLRYVRVCLALSYTKYYISGWSDRLGDVLSPFSYLSMYLCN